MNEEQNKIWEKECKDAEKAKGYVPAELLMIPMLVRLAEDGLVEIGGNDEYVVIQSTNKIKESNNGRRNSKNSR